MIDAASVRQQKRYAAALRSRGTCMACVNRERSAPGQGRATCRIGMDRQHPDCETDGRGLRFEFDPSVMKAFADAR